MHLTRYQLVLFVVFFFFFLLAGGIEDLTFRYMYLIFISMEASGFCKGVRIIYSAVMSTVNFSTAITLNAIKMNDKVSAVVYSE